MTVKKMKLDFEPHVVLYISKNLTIFNQHLAWQFRELKRAKLINSC